jgi:hypothetical protein
MPPLAAHEAVNLEEELVTLIKNQMAELPPNVATLGITRPKSDGVVAVVTPTNPAAARVVVHTANGHGIVNFSFGEYLTTWELPFDGHNFRANKEELLQEIGEMCRAVMAGNCEQKPGLLSIRASIQVGSRPYMVAHLAVFHAALPLWGTQKYEPYNILSG